MSNKIIQQVISAEDLAKRFHYTYEALAPQFSYETRKASAKPWEEIPENNRQLMIAVSEAILTFLCSCEAVDRLPAEVFVQPREGDKVNWIKYEWFALKDELPPENILVWTKIEDERGERNVAELQFNNRLWWYPSGDMHVYYTPTHWQKKLPYQVHEEKAKQNPDKEHYPIG